MAMATNSLQDECVRGAAEECLICTALLTIMRLL